MKVSKPDKIQEPSWTNVAVNCSHHDIGSALNWYNQNKSDKDARKYLIDYLKKNQLIEPAMVSAAESFDSNQFTTAGFVSRLLARGFILPANSKVKFDESVAEFLVKARDRQTVKDKPKAEVVSLQDRVQAKTDSFIAELEGFVDEFGIRGDANKMKAYEWMVNNEVKSIHAAKVAEFFSNRADILQKQYNDPVLREYYEGMSKKQFLNLFKCYANIALDATKLSSNQKAARKPRAKKAVSAEKKVAGVKYCVSDTASKLTSVDPVNILGAAQLWTYNIKTRKLTVYQAMDSAGLMVKGSSIENYSTAESSSKTLRKPENVLPKVLDGGKIMLRKIMGEINAKSSEPNGRINKDTILLRTVKS